jgi:hypothetical protein
MKHARKFDRGSWAILRLNHADETITQLIAELDNQEVAHAIEWLQKGHGLRVVKSSPTDARMGTTPTRTAG